MQITNEDILVTNQFKNDLQNRYDCYCFRCLPMVWGQNDNETFSALTSNIFKNALEKEDPSTFFCPECVINGDLLLVKINLSDLPITINSIHKYYNLAFFYANTEVDNNAPFDSAKEKLAFIIHIKDIQQETTVQDIVDYAWNYIYIDLRFFVSTNSIHLHNYSNIPITEYHTHVPDDTFLDQEKVQADYNILTASTEYKTGTQHTDDQLDSPYFVTDDQYTNDDDLEDDGYGFFTTDINIQRHIMNSLIQKEYPFVQQLDGFPKIYLLEEY